MTPGSVTPVRPRQRPRPAGRASCSTGRCSTHDPLNYHPLENDRTTAIAPADLLRFIAACGHRPRIVDLDARRGPADAPGVTRAGACRRRLSSRAAAAMFCEHPRGENRMANEPMIGGGGRRRGAGRQGRDHGRTSWPRSSMPRSTSRSSSISGRRGAGRASNWGRSSKRWCARPTARCAWSSSTSTRTPRSRSRCASSRSRRSMPSRTAGRSTALSAPCRKARSSSSSSASAAARGRPLADRAGDGDGEGGGAERRPCQRRDALFADPAARAGEPRGARRAGARADRARRTRQGDARCWARRRKEIAKHAEIAAARSALELAEQAQKAKGSLGKLRARIEQEPRRSRGALRAGDGAVRRRRARGGDRRAVDPVQARPRVGRAGGARASWSSSSRSWGRPTR